MAKTIRKVKTTRKRIKRIKVVEHPKASAKEFTNRDIGWLNFNERVLHEAKDARNPLLERVRFLAISCSNLDEFFMKRVGSIKRMRMYGITAKSSDGSTPEQQFRAIRDRVVPMLKDQAKCFEELRKGLEQESIFLLGWKDLTAAEKIQIKEYYIKNVFPVLTPLSVDPGHPFPFISNLSTSLAITLRHPERDERLFARLKIPKVFPQWIRINPTETSYRFVSLIEVIKENLQDLFPSMELLEVMPFRITRNAEAERDEEDAEDILEMMEAELKQRRFAEVVRLEVTSKPQSWMMQFLMDELEIHDEDFYQREGLLDYSVLNMIGELPIKKLKFPRYGSVTPSAFSDDNQSIFTSLKVEDHLFHHPYESFNNTVERFIREAALDPKVLAIKMTLYRTGENSPFVKSLIRAADAGKQVVCLVELKARFEEERNIYWAQALENAGVHVVYGVVGLKTHAKVGLVVRQEDDGLRCYAHIGTGNYNVVTSRFYTDVGLLTSKEAITNDIVELFHYLTGRSLKSEYQTLLVAPVNMFHKFKSMIEREADNAKAGKPSQIIAKFNNMEENDIALSLYQASQAGVGIDLIVRGFCCLRPQVPGLSENLRVTSIIGRFLEHSRVFYFRNGAADPVDGEFYVGSADWMYRNLHARVEAIVPVLDRKLREKLWEILQLNLTDQRQSWVMDSEGNYKQRTSASPGVQEQLMNLTHQRAAAVITEGSGN
ncbi:MAG: polyphosphate kinase 1 [Bdellovibrionota bacterium]